jgi:hypothetical protein
MAKLLTSLKFGEWLPDLPAIGNPGSPNVQNAGWDIMADLASYVVSLPAAGGTATALTVSNGRPFGALVPGLLQMLNPASANTGPATFAPDDLSATAVFANGAALAGGEMQPGVPVFLQYDGTQWNLLNPTAPGRNAFADPCCRVAQCSASAALQTTRNWGLVDAVQCWASGTAVSAGSITQDSAYAVAAAATAYSCKIAGATITGTGKVFFRRFIESRDAVAFRNGYGFFSALVRHDASTAINATLTVNYAAAQDNFTSVSNIATGTAVSVSSNTDTLVTVAIPNMGANTGNGIEVILEMDCGAVTTKDFWATDWQACLKTLAQKVAVPRIVDDQVDVMRNFQVLPTQRQVGFNGAGGTGNFNISQSYPVPMRTTPTLTIGTTSVSANCSSQQLLNPGPNGYTYQLSAVASSTFNSITTGSTADCRL